MCDFRKPLSGLEVIKDENLKNIYVDLKIRKCANVRKGQIKADLHMASVN